MTVVLTVAALDLGIDRAINYMAKVCNGYAVTGGRTQIQVPSRGLLDQSAGDDPNGSISRAADSLDALIRSTGGPKIAFGYSQGAQVCGTWLRRYAHTFDAPDHRELSFLLIGNPERRFGKQPWTKKITPDDTQYTVRDVARRGDKWANWQGKATDNRILAMFGGTHTDYWHSDLFDPTAEVVDVVGNTLYLVIP
jgi:hypothetical protein